MEKTIIELYGLPGIGKSTIINTIKNKSDLDNLNFIYLNYNKIKRYKYYLIVIFKYYKINLYFIKLLLQNESTNKINNLKFLFSWLKILSIYFIYSKSKSYKKYNILIMDQGLIQIIFSILNNSKKIKSNINKQNISKIIKEINKTFLLNLKYCYLIDIDIHIKRLKNRESNFSKYDKIKFNTNLLLKYIDKGNIIFHFINEILKQNHIKKEEINLH